LALALCWIAWVLANYYAQVWLIVAAVEWWAPLRDHQIVSNVRFVMPYGWVLLVVAGLAFVGVGLGLCARWRIGWPGLIVAIGLGGLLAAGVITRAVAPPALPFLPEALGRAASGVGGAATLLASAILLGSSISSALGWRYDGWTERLPFAAALGIGCFAYTGLSLAAAGLYVPAVLRVLVALPLIASARWLVRPGLAFLRGGRAAPACLKHRTYAIAVPLTPRPPLPRRGEGEIQLPFPTGEGRDRG
jgi:hypothetical protein